MKAIVFTIEEKEKVKCSKCGKESTFKKAVDDGWSVYAFHNKHLCNTCKDKND